MALVKGAFSELLGPQMEEMFRGRKVPASAWDRWKERWTPNWLRWLFPVSYVIVSKHKLGVDPNDWYLVPESVYHEKDNPFEPFVPVLDQTFPLSFTYTHEMLDSDIRDIELGLYPNKLPITETQLNDRGEEDPSSSRS